MKKANSIIAYNIKLLRTQSHLTQEEFAKKLNSTQRNITVYENGYAEPKADFTFLLATSFGIPVEFLKTKKLRIDKEGKFINLPKTDSELNEARKELKLLFDTFKNSVEEFYEGVKKINERIDRIEKAISKKIKI